jgi:glycosyltransferase involved in cell wall biosynthesis
LSQPFDGNKNFMTTADLDQDRKDRPAVSVIIPVYNEERHLAELCRHLDDLLASRPQWELIFVDDASEDRSSAMLSEHMPRRARVVNHDRNRGKAAALRTGIRLARGAVITFQDADLEYSPEELPNLVQPVLEGKAVACFGDRFHQGRPPGMRLQNYLANRGLSSLTGILFRANIHDMETCYKAFRADFLRSFELQAERFGIKPELTSRTLQRGENIQWVPISYVGRSIAEGKKIGWKDGIEAVQTLLRCRFVHPKVNS